MRLLDRLNELIGHRIAVDIPGDEDGWGRIKGTLQKVGEDYVMITEWDHIAGCPVPGHCFVKIDKTVPIIHTADCRQCDN